MGRFRVEKLPKEERIKLVGEFYDAMSCVKNREEARSFFRDLLSFDEIAMLVRRIQVALLLIAGYGYRDIEKALNVGGDKIINVQRSLQRHGEGYRLMIQRLRKIVKEKEKRENKRQRELGNGYPSLQSLKKRYPMHFLLFNLVDEIGDWLQDDGKVKIERKIEFNKRTSKKIQ